MVSQIEHGNAAPASTPNAPPLLAAGEGGEPVEMQVFIAVGEAVAIAYDLNVIINRDRIAVRSIAGAAPARRIQSAAPREPWDAATRAMVALLRDLGMQHTPRLAS